MSNHKFTMGSLFDGSGGFPLGAQLSGIEPVWASEVEPYPIAVTRHHFPNMKHLGDVSNIHGGEIDPVDVVTFGSPCFPAGTMIDTDKGRVPIEKVTVGMRVLTHMGRYRHVLAVGSKTSDTIILWDEFGGTLECTRNHPIYSAKKVMYNGVNVIGGIGVWTQAQDMLGLLWSRPVVPKDKFNNPYLFVNAWQKVVSISVGRENIPVYNMTVAIDNSYIADGIIVHNCQDMSVAGKRAGLLHTGKGDDTTTRSGLFYEAVRIIKEMRESTHGKYPSFAVWENVPGAFSSNKGEDFRCVLEELLQIAEGGLSIPRPANGKWLHAGEILADHCSIAWRILDAQYWGVPQRRKRIYLVADFGGQRAGSILFEREGLSGNIEPGEAQGQVAPGDAGGGVDRSGQPCGGYSSPAIKCLNPLDAQSIRQYDANGTYPTLSSNASGGQNRQGVVYEPKSAMEENWDKSDVKMPCTAFHLQQDPISGEVSPCIGGQGQASVGVFMGGQGAKARGIAYSESVAPTLKSVLSGGNTIPDVVCATPTLGAYGVDCRNGVLDKEKVATLQAHANGGYSLNSTHPILYPVEGANENL